MGYRLVVDRFVRLDTKDPNDPTSRVVRKTRYSKGDVIEGLSDSEVDRLVEAGAIVREGEEDEGLEPEPTEPDVPVIKTATEDDPTNVGTEVRDLGISDEPQGSKEATGDVPQYDEWDYERIKSEAEARGVTGPDGSLKKKDLLEAIKAHDNA